MTDNHESGADYGSGDDWAALSALNADGNAYVMTGFAADTPQFAVYALPLEGAVTIAVQDTTDDRLLWVTTDTGAVYVVDTSKTPPTCDRVA